MVAQLWSKKAVIVIFLLLIIVRFYVFSKIPTAQTYPESTGYLLIANGFSQTHSLRALANPAHTPGYPFVLSLGDVNVVSYIQTVCAVLSILMLLFVLHYYKFPRSVLVLYGLLSVTLLQIVIPEKMILSESFSMTWIVCVAAFFALLLKSETEKFMIFLMAILTLLESLGWVIRPTFLPLVPVINIVIVLLKPRKSVMVFAWLSTFICLLSAFLYGNIVANLTGYHGITYISDVSYLGKVLQYNLPLPSACPKNEDLCKRYLSYVSDPFHPTNLFVFINTRYTDVYTNTSLYEGMGEIGRKVILNNLGTYAVKTVQNVPKIIFSFFDDFSIQSIFRSDLFGNLLYILSYIVRFLILIIYIVAPLSLVQVFFSASREKKLISFFSVLVGFNYMFILVFAYSDFDRYLAPFFPLTLFIVLFWWYKIFCWVKVRFFTIFSSLHVNRTDRK